MEFIEGIILTDYMSEREVTTIDIDGAVEIISSIAKTLFKIHKLGIIHQDVSLKWEQMIAHLRF